MRRKKGGRTLRSSCVLLLPPLIQSELLIGPLPHRSLVREPELPRLRAAAWKCLAWTYCSVYLWTEMNDSMYMHALWWLNNDWHEGYGARVAGRFTSRGPIRSDRLISSYFWCGLLTMEQLWMQQSRPGLLSSAFTGILKCPLTSATETSI